MFVVNSSFVKSTPAQCVVLSMAEILSLYLFFRVAVAAISEIEKSIQVLLCDAKMLRPRVARFFLVLYSKTGKMYQMNTKCTKWY
jgi:hypothetical protein